MTANMRAQLLDGLTGLWEQALATRRAFAAVSALDRLLREVGE
jgi:hypothetical protein